MALSNTLTIKQNDTLPVLSYRVDLPDGLSLTGATAVFSMRHRESNTLVTGAASIDDFSNTLIYTWGVGDTAELGVYDGEFRVTFSGGAVGTFPSLAADEYLCQIEVASRV